MKGQGQGKRGQDPKPEEAKPKRAWPNSKLPAAPTLPALCACGPRSCSLLALGARHANHSGRKFLQGIKAFKNRVQGSCDYRVLLRQACHPQQVLRGSPGSDTLRGIGSVKSIASLESGHYLLLLGPSEVLTDARKSTGEQGQPSTELHAGQLLRGGSRRSPGAGGRPSCLGSRFSLKARTCPLGQPLGSSSRVSGWGSLCSP